MPMKTKKVKATVLIIDDDPDFLKLVSLMLKSTPYSIITASDPKTGKEKILSEKPDLILLDIMMDSLFDGISLCHDIKTSEEYREFRNTPVIHVSAIKKLAGSRFAFDGGEQGVRGPDDYLDKPVEAKNLIARIEKLLKE